MLDIIGGGYRLCDGVTRRDLLKVGTLALGGLALPELLRRRAAAGGTGGDTAVILIWLTGGPSHIDTYDMKPRAPAEYRGAFRPIETAVPGIAICEHLPRQAQVMDKLAIVRSACHTEPGHGRGMHWLRTGYRPAIDVSDNIYPSCGSVVARLRGANRAGIPPYVTVPKTQPFTKAAYLGAAYNPFSPESDPNSDRYEVRNLQLPGRIDRGRFEGRRNLLADLDGLRRDLDTEGTMAGLDRFYAEALAMVTSDQARAAFDIKREDPALRAAYGRNDLGQSCLLARRLVEAGVTFVSVMAAQNWDTHANNFNDLKTRLLPAYDQAVAALVTDLDRRGLSRRVLVLALGEFGRTPRINKDAGRDHWPGAMSVLFAGGGLRMGQVVGATDAHAESPTSRPFSPASVLATVYHVLGIDIHETFHDTTQRPMPVLNEGSPIEELI